MLVEGDATTDDPIGADKVREGVHEYEVHPEAVSVLVFGTQMLYEVAAAETEKLITPTVPVTESGQRFASLIVHV